MVIRRIMTVHSNILFFNSFVSRYTLANEDTLVDDSAKTRKVEGLYSLPKKAALSKVWLERMHEYAILSYMYSMSARIETRPTSMTKKEIKKGKTTLKIIADGLSMYEMLLL